jgi:hypothetical protein
MILNATAHETILTDHEPIRVHGAFGGLAFYSMEALVKSGATYTPHKMLGKPCAWHPDVRPVCENAGICINLVNAGHDKIYINPKQVVLRL